MCHIIQTTKLIIITISLGLLSVYTNFSRAEYWCVASAHSRPDQCSRWLWWKRRSRTVSHSIPTQPILNKSPSEVLHLALSLYMYIYMQHISLHVAMNAYIHIHIYIYIYAYMLHLSCHVLLMLISKGYPRCRRLCSPRKNSTLSLNTLTALNCLWTVALAKCCRTGVLLSRYSSPFKVYIYICIYASCFS